jgi:transcriptional regulator with XRE-family HTH domain
MKGTPLPKELLRTARAATGMTQEAFAAAVGVPHRSYTRYETGETKKVPAEVVIKAQALAARRTKKKS